MSDQHSQHTPLNNNFNNNRPSIPISSNNATGSKRGGVLKHSPPTPTSNFQQHFPTTPTSTTLRKPPPSPIQTPSSSGNNMFNFQPPSNTFVGNGGVIAPNRGATTTTTLNTSSAQNVSISSRLSYASIVTNSSTSSSNSSNSIANVMNSSSGAILREDDLDDSSSLYSKFSHNLNSNAHQQPPQQPSSLKEYSSEFTPLKQKSSSNAMVATNLDNKLEVSPPPPLALQTNASNPLSNTPTGERKKKLRKSGSTSSALSTLLSPNATTNIGINIHNNTANPSLNNDLQHKKKNSIADVDSNDEEEDEFITVESPTFALAPSVVKKHKMKQQKSGGGSPHEQNTLEITNDLLTSIEQSMEDLLDSDNVEYNFPGHIYGGGIGSDGETSTPVTTTQQPTHNLPPFMFSSTNSNNSMRSGPFHSTLDLNIPYIYTTSEEEIEISTNGSISTNTTSTSLEEFQSGIIGSITPTTIIQSPNNKNATPYTNNQARAESNRGENQSTPPTSPGSPLENKTFAAVNKERTGVHASPTSKALPKVKSKAVLEYEDDVTSDSSNSSTDEELFSQERTNSNGSNSIDYSQCSTLHDMNEIFEKTLEEYERDKKLTSEAQFFIANAPSFQSLLFALKKLKEQSLLHHENSSKIRSNIFQSLKRKIKELNNKYQMQSIGVSSSSNSRKELDTVFDICNFLLNEDIIYSMIQSPILSDINSEKDLENMVTLLENIQSKMNISFNNSVQGYFRLFDGTKKWLIHVFTHNLRIVLDFQSPGTSSSNQARRSSTSLLSLLQSQQNTISLEKFMRFLDRLVRLNFLNEYSHVLLDELMLTPFFVSLTSFDFIEHMGKFSGSQFSNKLRSYIIDKCCQLISQTATSKDASLLFELIESKIEDATVRYVYLKTLLFAANIQHSYESIVKNPLCYYYFKFAKVSQKIADENYVKIEKEVSDLMDIYFKLVFQLLDKTCTISTLNMVLKHEAQFVKLIYVMGDVGFNEGHLKQLRQELVSFKTTLDAVQNFLTMFADDPNFFDTNTVLDTIIKIRRNMTEMVFKKVQKQVSDLIPFSFEDLAFFYELRTSEFFLVLWRDLYSKNNDEKHSIDSIKTKLIPAVRKRWADYYASLDTLSMKLSEFYNILRKCRYDTKLDNIFSGASSLYEEELLRVRMTFSGKASDRKPSREDLEWVSKRHNIIRSYESINLYRSYLPSLIALVEHFEPYFSVDLKKDLDYIQLKKEATILNSQSLWEEQTLSMFENQRTSLDSLSFAKFFKNFSDNQMSFMKLLSDNSGFSIIDWLANYKSNLEFDNLLEVCKSYTDSVKVLQSLKSLVVIRDVVSELLYGSVEATSVTFTGFTQFHSVLTKLPIGSDELVQLTNLKKNFTLLLEMFEERTRSGGVQALYDLAAILERGIFEFSLAGQHVISCKVVPSSSISSSSPSRRMSNQHQIISMEGLVELRNKLMLSEIPDNINSLDDVHSKIKLYVSYITLMIELRSSLLELSRSAHFDFQDNYFKTIKASECTFEVIQDYHSQVLQKMTEWKKIVEDSRNKYYFINLFRAKESLHIFNLLTRYKEETKNDILRELLDILQLGDHNLTVNEIEACMNGMQDVTFSKEMSVAAKMEKLCLFIEALFRNRNINYRKSDYTIPSAITSKYSVANFGGFFRIIKLSKEKEVMDAIMTIYSAQNRLPLSEEVLLCNSHETDIEDIYLILNRWFKSSANGKLNHIFCIGNIHELPFSVQSKMLLRIQEQISTMAKASNNHAKLVLLSGADSNSRLLVEFSQYVDSNFKLLPHKYISAILKSYHGNHVKYVFSNRTAAGKTRYILKDIYTNKKKYKRITVLEDSTIRDTVFTLKRTVENMDRKDIAFHFSLCPLVPKHFNSLFFELFYLGRVRDHDTATIFHLTPSTQFYIEIPNSLCVPILNEFIYFCAFLPSLDITTDENSLDFTSYELANGMNDTIEIIARDNSKKVQFVCKFLKAFEENIFKYAAPHIADFSPDKQADLDNRKCFKLLCKYTGFNYENASFSVINHFVGKLSCEFFYFYIQQ